MPIVTNGHINGLTHIHTGKIRTLYAIPDHPGLLLMVQSDRISTHNQVHLTEIPHKGEVLTALTVFWLTGVLSDLPHHLVAAGRRIYELLPTHIETQYPDLHRRALIVRKLAILKVEFIWRRYLTGSLWKAYNHEDPAERDPYGLCLPGGLPLMYRFNQLPLFTPTRKSDVDEPMLTNDVIGLYPNFAEVTCEVFLRVERFLAGIGIILVDTKLEGDGISIGDEIGTPDSCRLVMEGDVVEGKSPPWHDKQHVRDEVERVQGPDPTEPMELTDAVVHSTSEIYRNMFMRITSMSLDTWVNDGYLEYRT